MRPDRCPGRSWMHWCSVCLGSWLEKAASSLRSEGRTRLAPLQKVRMPQSLPAAMIAVVNTEAALADLDADQLRALASRLMGEVRHKQALIDKITHENAVLKRLRFGVAREHFSAERRSLIEDTIDADIEAVQAELAQLNPKPAAPLDKQVAKRKPLPAELARREFKHEPENTVCGFGCQMTRIGEDVAEKLDDQPGVFSVERHVRGKWACKQCERLVQAPVAPHVIDRASRRRACWPRCWWPSTPITSRCIGKRASCPGRRGAGALDAGAMGGFLRCAVAAVGRRAQGGDARAPRAACR
jgi:hypothetical protein